jgi:hypothetical protein
MKTEYKGEDDGNPTVTVVPLADTVGISGVTNVVKLHVVVLLAFVPLLAWTVNVYRVFPVAPVKAQGLTVLVVVRVGDTVGVLNADPVAAIVIVLPVCTTDVMVGAATGVTGVDDNDTTVLPTEFLPTTTNE